MKSHARKVVYADGTFDLFHSGHVAFLKRARCYGNYLIVGVLGDECVESYKCRPVLTLHERARFLKCVQIVDEIIAPAPFPGSKYGGMTAAFLDQYQIDYVAYAGRLSDWADHYQIAMQRGLMLNIPYGSGELSSAEIKNRVIKRAVL